MSIEDKISKLQKCLEETGLEIEVGSFGLIIRDEDSSYVSSLNTIKSDDLRMVQEMDIVYV